MTDTNLLTYLAQNSIYYVLHQHQPMHTMDDVLNLQADLQGPIPKNLFLKSNKSDFYLVSMIGSKKLDLKLLKIQFGVSEFKFASEDELYSCLKLKPGSVSIFGLVNFQGGNNLTVILDSELYNSPWVAFHPNLNTETIELSHDDFMKFWNLITLPKIVLDL